MKKRILFIPENETALNEFCSLAKEERVRESIFAELLLIESLESRAKDPNVLASFIPGKIHVESDFIPFGTLGSFAGRVIAAALSWLRLRELSILLRLIIWKMAAQRLLSRIDMQALAISSDRSIGITIAIINESEKRGLRSAVLPIALSSSVGPLHLRSKQPFYSINIPANAAFASRYPEHAKKSENHGTLLFYPWWVANSLARVGLLPSRPWGLGASGAYLVCASSVHSRDLLIQDGVPSSKIRITGMASHDRLFYSLNERSTLRSRLLKSKEDSLIILAVPQFAEHALMTWEEHWKELNWILNELKGVRAKLALSLHPKSDHELYAKNLVGDWFQILPIPLHSALPAADVFVSCYSSTTDWALLCGIPSVCFDFYGMNYRFYDHHTSLRIVRNRGEFKSTLESLVITHTTQKCDPLLDGQSVNRILSVLDECIK